MDKNTTVALITGGNKGIGREVVETLAGRGWHVFLGSRNEQRGIDAADECAAAGLSVEFVHLDVTSDESVKAAAACIAERTEHVDVLVNNAGIPGDYTPAADVSIDEFAPVYATNVLGPVRVTNAFLPMLQRSSCPRIVMVSSGMGSVGRTTDPQRMEYHYGDLVYTSSKAALNMITTQYARALPGVKVNAADPGLTATDFGGGDAPNTVAEGAAAVISLATLGPEGPSGTFTDRHGIVPW